jgi:hypothetical protein
VIRLGGGENSEALGWSSFTFLQHTCLAAFTRHLPQQETSTFMYCSSALLAPTAMLFQQLAVRPASGVTNTRVTGLMAVPFSLEKRGQTGQPLSLPGEVCISNFIPDNVPGSLGFGSFGPCLFSALSPALLEGSGAWGSWCTAWEEENTSLFSCPHSEP